MIVRAKYLRAFDEKNKGLLGEQKAFNVYFETRFGIHTFFLNFPIDVVILDGQNRIVKAKNNLKQNRIFFWNIKYTKVLELESGSLEKLGLKKGQQVKLILT